MRTYLQDANQAPKAKHSTAKFAAKYWATLGHEGKKVTNKNGRVFVDKTHGFHSRPAKKAELRQANRAQHKQARRALKQELEIELNEHARRD